MNNRLTININENTIEGAKLYAKENKVSLSYLVENYLSSLIKSSLKERNICPLVESLTGVIPDEKIDEHIDYQNYLTKKYL